MQRHDGLQEKRGSHKENKGENVNKWPVRKTHSSLCTIVFLLYAGDQGGMPQMDGGIKEKKQ